MVNCYDLLLTVINGYDFRVCGSKVLLDIYCLLLSSDDLLLANGM
jgi:hypothetical protein